VAHPGRVSSQRKNPELRGFVGVLKGIKVPSFQTGSNPQVGGKTPEQVIEQIKAEL
jgi:hypothetical protein